MIIIIISGEPIKNEAAPGVWYIPYEIAAVTSNAANILINTRVRHDEIALSKSS